MSKAHTWLVALSRAKEILDRNQIVCFLDMGTLLGAIREGGFIPWDNDIDLGVLEANGLHEKLLSACRQLEDAGFDVAYCDKSISLQIKDEVEINIAVYAAEDACHVYRYLLPDRFSPLRHSLKMLIAGRYYVQFSSRRDGAIRRLVSEWRRVAALLDHLLDKAFPALAYKTSRVPFGYLDRLDDFVFLGVSVKVPSNPESYLQFRYGEQWRIPTRKWLYFSDDGAIAS